MLGPLSIPVRHRPPASPTLFPYTTLFRSQPEPGSWRQGSCSSVSPSRRLLPAPSEFQLRACEVGIRMALGANRSEEHTSELQTRQYLVCRLLLAKKKARRAASLEAAAARP